MSEFVSQREFDQYTKSTDRELAQLRHDLDELEEQRERDATDRRAGLAQRIAGIGAGAAVIAACVAVVELWRSSGR